MITIRTKVTVLQHNRLDAIIFLQMEIFMEVRPLKHSNFQRLTRIDFGRSSEPVVKNVADLTKCRQPHPACLDSTTTRHAVTLALLTHVIQHVLNKTHTHTHRQLSFLPLAKRKMVRATYVVCAYV